MKAFKNINEFKKIGTDIRFSIRGKDKPSALQSLTGYLKYIGHSWLIALKEKEIFFFIFMQWVSILIGYYIFVVALYLIPQEVWESVRDSDGGSVVDIALFLWMLACIAIATFPLGIFSSCMAVSHMLHLKGEDSTIAKCLHIVLPHSWFIWVFHYVDGYITVQQIIERLPKKNDNTSWSERMISEGIYYAWKIGSMAIFPNVVTGRGIKDTAKNSVGIIKDYFFELAMIRVGYSIFCWIIGVGTYIWGVFNYHWIKEKFFPGELHDTIADFYFHAGIPLLIAIAVIKLFLRPAYLLAISDYYVIFIENKGEDVLSKDSPRASISAAVAYALFCTAFLLAYIYRYELGIMEMFATPYKTE